MGGEAHGIEDRPWHRRGPLGTEEGGPRQREGATVPRTGLGQGDQEWRKIQAHLCQQGWGSGTGLFLFPQPPLLKAP